MAGDRVPLQSLQLLDIADELICHILSFLPPAALALAARTSKQLRNLALDDNLWRGCIQAHLSYPLPPKPPRKKSWRKHYIELHPYWFVAHHRVWISDYPNAGGLVMARYSLFRNRIEAYTLHASPSNFPTPAPVFWEQNAEVIIVPFDPTIIVDVDQPFFLISTNGPYGESGPWCYYSHPDPFVQLARRLPPDEITSSTALWPPQTLPAASRTMRLLIDEEYYGRDDYLPDEYSEVSEHAFRIRPPEAGSHPLADIPEFAGWLNLHGNEGIRNSNPTQTFATLPLESYTPTADKPWRGIWIGDYPGHSYEFLAFLQPDVPVSLPHTAARKLTKLRQKRSIGVLDSEEKEGGLPRSSGQLLGVKITGDVNVPRGEYSFIIPDLGPGGTMRFAEESMFKGARVVSGVGHIAGQGFTQDAYIPAQMFLLSTGRVAMYWEDLGHISYFVRANIDEVEARVSREGTTRPER